MKKEKTTQIQKNLQKKLFRANKPGQREVKNLDRTD